jgi:hypothetical protein
MANIQPKVNNKNDFDEQNETLGINILVFDINFSLSI